MIVIYFHGFASGPNTKKVSLLKESGFNVVAPRIDIDPRIAEKYLVDFIMDTILDNENERIILVGTSLGGFWAARMNTYFDIETVLINPALTPEKSLKRFLGAYTDYDTRETKVLTSETVSKYVDFPVFHDEEAHLRTYFIAEYDTLVRDYMLRKKVYKSEDHQGLSFFPDVIEYIKYLESKESVDFTEHPDFS